MKAWLITMSMSEIERLKVMQKLAAGILKQKHAASMLGISTKQVRRLYNNLNKQRAGGLVSKQRCKTSNRSYTDDIKNAALRLAFFAALQVLQSL